MYQDLRYSLCGALSCGKGPYLEMLTTKGGQPVYYLIIEQIVSTIEDCADVHVDLTMFAYSIRVIT